MSNLNMQSNAIRGEYMRNIMDKTIGEIHDDIVTIFGPYATDAYITRDKQPYFTRDGLEVIRSLRFDNELAMYILSIMYQAVYAQGKKVGDGTTTLAVLYTNLYKQLRENELEGLKFSRDAWDKTIKMVNDKIKERAHPMTEEDLKSVLLTCTQDFDLAAKIYKNLHEAIMNRAYITIEKSNIETDFDMTIHNSPVFKATRQFSVRPVKAKEDRCTIFHCNGILDIAHFDVLLSLMTRLETINDGMGNPQYFPKTIILLCNGISEATRRTTKELVKELQLFVDGNGGDQSVLNTFNNIAIYTLDEYRQFTSEQIEDISTIITDEKGIGGLVNQLTFESLLYQSLCDMDTLNIPELSTYDCDIHHIDKMRSIFAHGYEVEFDDIEGMRIHKKFGPVAQARYEELKKAIEEEKSEVAKIGLSRRMRTMYGQFIEVSVGSKLIKDSQRKYELILDAVLSAGDGVEHGVLGANSILIALDVVTDMMNAEVNHASFNWLILNTIYHALSATMCDMINNCDSLIGFANISDDEFYKWFKGKDYSKFNLKNEVILPDNAAVTSPYVVLPETNAMAQVSHIVSEADEDGVTVDIADCIVEPVSIITTMLENSSLMVELANAKTFHLDGFMRNYI